MVAAIAAGIAKTVALKHLVITILENVNKEQKKSTTSSINYFRVSAPVVEQWFKLLPVVGDQTSDYWFLEKNIILMVAFAKFNDHLHNNRFIYFHTIT